MINHDALARLDMRRPETWIATWGGTGLLKPAPGTWGTLGGLPLGIGLMMLGGIPALLAGLAVILPLGWWATTRLEGFTGDHDAGYIVIDEVAGLLVTLLAATLTPFSLFAAFILFRAFDIVKPWPCNWLDQKLTGATSVMLDDLAAGFYAALVLIGLRYAGIG